MDDQGIRNVVNIIPMAIFEGLETLDKVGNKNGESTHIGMRHHPES